jgi:hypothetical protein
MRLVRHLLGFGGQHPTGPGLPQGYVLELRTVVLVVLSLITVLVIWFWQKEEEKRFYSLPEAKKPENIRTAAGP